MLSPSRVFVLGLLACKPASDDDLPTVVPSSSSGCEVDDACDRGEICEANFCVVGDRDNRFEEASTIRLNEVVAGIIEPPGDIDFYVYESTGPEWIRVQTTNSGDPIDSLDTVLQVFATNGAEHARADNFATGRVNNFDSVAIVYLPTAGTWFLTVEDVSTHYEGEFEEPRGGSDFNYTIELLEFNNRTIEPDAPDSAGSPIDLQSGSSIVTMGILLEGPGDADWMRVTLPFAGEPFEVWGVPIPGSDATPLVNLYRESDMALLASKPGVGTEGVCSYFDPEQVTYLVEATDVNGQGSNDHWFVLYLRTWEPNVNHPIWGTTDFPNEIEPNDDPALPEVPVVVSDENANGEPFEVAFTQGVLFEDADVDGFEIALDANEKLSVRCWDTDFGSLADLRIEVEGDGIDLTPADQGSDATSLGYFLHNLELGAGVYRVAISAEDGVGGPGAYYRCAMYQTAFDVVVDVP